jgi:uncharacterized membrane protein YvlD (DUF360 family)
MSRLAPVDRWTLGYAFVATLALVLHWPVRTPAATLLPLAHVGLFAVALLAPHARRAGGLGRFLGAFYPLLLVTFLYSEIGLMNASAGRSFDPTVQRWEAALFGMQPSFEWNRAWPWIWLSWPLHVAYLSYYLLVPGPPLALWLSGRRRAASRTVLLIAVTFYLCYVGFLLFPVAGPRYAFPLATNAATAIAPAVLLQRILNVGAAWGTALPSSHVAVALVSSLHAGRSRPILGVLFVPLALLLTLGTVYGQFHYAMDALSGMALAALVLALGRDRSATADQRG